MIPQTWLSGMQATHMGGMQSRKFGTRSTKTTSAQSGEMFISTSEEVPMVGRS